MAFSSHFCFLVISVLLILVSSVLSLEVVISLSPHFYMWSSSRCINASTLASIMVSLLPPSFLDTYSLSTSSLGCNAVCMVISFLMIWSICFFSLINFKNGPEYLTKGTALVFISFIGFQLYSFVSSRFLVLLRFSFIIIIIFLASFSCPR